MLSIAVCDDELLECLHIAARIRALTEELQIPCSIEHFSSGSALLDALDRFDLIFLDILMDGMDGMETARQIRRDGSQAVLIFLTALEEYVFQAFDVEAFQYLLKPLKKEKFYQVMELAVKKAQETSREQQQRGVVIKSGAVTRKMKLSEIICAEVQNRKITVHSTEGELEFYGKLSEFEKKLGEDFICPHRSYLIHFAYVSSYTAADITMDDGTVVPMAKQRYRAFVGQYLQYMKRQKRQTVSGGDIHA